MDTPLRGDRRSFIEKLGYLGAAALMTRPVPSTQGAEAAGSPDIAAPDNLAARGEMPRRKFGKTDVVVSAMGLGGHTFAQARSESEAIRIVQEAVDAGMTFLDNAWEYHQGRSE